MNELTEQLETKMQSFQKDAALQAQNGNKAAGLRARRTSLEIQPLLKEFRKRSLDVSEEVVICFCSLIVCLEVPTVKDWNFFLCYFH